MSPYAYEDLEEGIRTTINYLAPIQSSIARRNTPKKTKSGLDHDQTKTADSRAVTTENNAHGESIRLSLKRSVGVSGALPSTATLPMSTFLSMLHRHELERLQREGFASPLGKRTKPARLRSKRPSSTPPALVLILPVRQSRPCRQIARAAGLRQLEGGTVARTGTASIVLSRRGPESSPECDGALAEASVP